MKFAFYGVLLFVFGCKIEQTRNHPSLRIEDSGHAVSDAHDKNTIKKSKGFFEKSIARINAFFHVLDDSSPFCQAIMKTSPTREDFIRNWQPDGEVHYCPNGAPSESCNKQNNNAFQEGLLCYKNHFFSIGD